MRANLKLTLALLGATAMFTLGLSFVTDTGYGNAELLAEEMPLDQEAIDGLSRPDGSLEPARAGSAISVTSLTADQDFSELAPKSSTLTSENIKKQFAPGENPFVVGMPLQAGGSLGTRSSSQAKAANPSSPSATSYNASVASEATVTADYNSASASKSSTVTAKVDDRALRYYATNKDLKRLGAEMRRLKALYPDWRPPSDLFSAAVSVDEQPLWDIFKAGNYAAVRAKIAQMQSANPKWQPSDDLMGKLQNGETRSLLHRAYLQHRWKDVVATAQARSDILLCSDMEVLWDVGEAFAQLRDYSGSFDIYKYVLTTCEDQQMRTATMQKAAQLLPEQGVQSLISYGRVGADGVSEFEDIGFNRLRRQVGEYIQHGDLSSAPSTDDLKRFIEFVDRKGSGADAELMGWFFYTQENWSMSNAWFLLAAQFEKTPKSLEGVVLTLRNLDRPLDAYKVSRRYLKSSPDLAKQYIEIVSEALTTDKPNVAVDDKLIDEFTDVVRTQKSALGAQALGWRYLASEDAAKAKDWFTQSVAWQPTEGGVVGLAVLAARSKNYRELAVLKSKYEKQYGSLEDFKVYKAKLNKTKKHKKRGNFQASNSSAKGKRAAVNG